LSSNSIVARSSKAVIYSSFILSDKHTRGLPTRSASHDCQHAGARPRWAGFLRSRLPNPRPAIGERRELLLIVHGHHSQANLNSALARAGCRPAPSAGPAGGELRGRRQPPGLRKKSCGAARRSTWAHVSPNVRTGPAGGINNSGGRCVAGAASENLKLACIAIGGMRRSPAQVRVLATYGAGHTIVEAEHSTAGSRHRRCALRGARASTAITTGVRRAISGMMLIETAHFFYPLLSVSQGKIRAASPSLNWCNAQIVVDYLINRTRNGFWGWDPEVAMRYQEVSPSRLPSLLVPCPLCVHRMVITAVEPALLADGNASNDLEDVTHRCVQCGTTIIRTIPTLSSVA
jgi:hypothetical protein